MAITESPWKAARDSPSRQLLWELSRLAITTQEDIYERLDRESQEREAAHRSALAQAIAKHEKVRKDAEAERDRLEKQMQQDKERRDAEARQEEERQRQATIEREKVEKRRAVEQAEAAARAERAATEERNAEITRKKNEKELQDAEVAKAKKAQQEAEAKKKADDERRLKVDTSAAHKSHSDTPAVRQPVAVTSRNQSQLQQREAEHRRYLKIHKDLKELRNFMVQQAKQQPKLKSRMGDMRRDIKKSVGQIIEGKGQNVKPQKKIMDTLREATASFPQPTVNLATFTARPIQDTQAPALFVYLFNQFAKAIVSQFISEAAVQSKVADPVGTIAISMFARDEFKVGDLSLIDILIAKFHVVCPPLFGIYGAEETDEGRTRLGWWREEPGRPWIREQSHQDRMTGLGAGYAALSLRNFENSRMTNPYPPYHFWRALTAILNVPNGQVTETHLILLRALLMNSEQRFMEFFGDAAKKLLQIALLEYPKRAKKGSVAAAVLSTLGDVIKKDKKLYFCLRNVVSMFHVIEKEMQWRKANGRPEGFETLKRLKPIVAVGADEPLGGERLKAAYYHGVDGLGGVHTS
ncbi:MAG: hypothetical protein Q9170_007935, partial [Blastenia crenularia]